MEQELFYPPPPSWTTRWCTSGKHWAETKFGGDNRKWHGNQCPDCNASRMVAVRAADPEYNAKMAEYHRNRRATDPEYRERENTRARENWAANPDQRRQRMARQKESLADPANRERKNRARREFRKTPEGQAANLRNHRNRRARKMNAVCEHGSGCFDDVAKADISQVCVRCGTTERIEADHIVALANGGLDCGVTNYQPLCRSCNASKNDRE